MRITTPLNDQEQSSQDSPRKMFVGGLSWLTTPENLRDYFQNYGEVLECMIMKDAFTKRSRGFGFITFQDSSSVDKVLAQEKHFLDEKQIDPKVAFPRQKHPRMVTKTRKAFVGGLSASTNEQQLREYFSTFGEVEEVTLMYDRTTLRHRGFGFVTFATEEACDDVVNIHYHQINDRKVECKKAQPKELMWAHNYNKSKNALARSQLSDIIGSIPLSAGYPPITLLTRPISIGSYAFANCYEFPLVPFDHINPAIPSTGLAYIQAAPPPPAAIPASDRNPAVFEMLNQAAMTAAPNALELVPLDNPLNNASFISRTNNSQGFFPGPVYTNGFH